MKTAGRAAAYVSGIRGVIAAATAVAAGAILAKLVDAMIPEAFEVARDFAGLITVAGFLAGVALRKLGG